MDICKKLTVFVLAMAVSFAVPGAGGAQDETAGASGFSGMSYACASEAVDIRHTGAAMPSGMQPADETPEIAIPAPLLSCRYYDESGFRASVYLSEDGVNSAGASQDETGNGAGDEAIKGTRVLGGIVTHHLLASGLIASFFKAVSAGSPDIVFIIGPNHKRIGSEKINTGVWDWQTPFGILKTDDEAAERLIGDCGAGKDFNLLEQEHSIAALIPYVKYYMPDTRVVPILLHGNLGIERSEELAEEICKAGADRRWIAIGSVDFSHYLPPETADKMDNITQKAIETRNFEALDHMGNDNLDSPPTVITMLKLMDMEGASGPRILAHSNSAYISGRYSDSTTSYFTMLFK